MYKKTLIATRPLCLSIKLYTSFTLLLFVTSCHPLIEKDKTGKITNFEELNKAITRAEEEVKENPQAANAHYRLARLLLMNGSIADAQQSLQEALKIEPEHISSLLALAGIHWRMFRFEEAEEALARAKSIDPEKEETHLLDAHFAAGRTDLRTAENILRDVLGKNPKSTAALCGLASICNLENKYDATEKFIRQCLTEDPAFARAYLIQSMVQRNKQDYDRSAQSVRKAVSLAPFDDAARVHLAYILNKEGKIEEGYQQICIALRINPFNYKAHSFLGNGWSPKNYRELKIEGDKDTLNQIRNLLSRADEALLNQKYSIADDLFSRVLELSPDNITALIGKGTVNYHLEQYRAAIEWFSKVLDIDFDHGLAHYGISQSLLRLKDRINVLLAGIEEEFASEVVEEPPFMRDVFINYEQLDPDLQKILCLSVHPLRFCLKSLKEAGATFYIIPFHKLLWESPYLERLKGLRTFDKRLWDDVKGCGGIHATSGWDWQRDVKYGRFNMVAHEFAHQVEPFLPRDIQQEIARLYTKAKKERKTLDYYANSNKHEYFATGVEAYVSEKKLPDQKSTSGNTRKELLEKDPDLYRLIESLGRSEEGHQGKILRRLRSHAFFTEDWGHIFFYNLFIGYKSFYHLRLSVFDFGFFERFWWYQPPPYIF
jgi:tetratricopeptide (TPR) repeat protein